GVYADLGVAAIVPTLIALLHHPQLRVGETRLRLVVGHLAHGLGLLAAPLLPGALPLRLGLRAALALRLGLRPRSLLQPPLGGAEDGQARLAPVHLGRQLVAAAAAQGRVLLGVGLLRLPEQGLDLGAQAGLFLLHVAVAHGLVPGGLAQELAAI